MNKQIKVGFDISQLAHTGGVNTYTRNLTSELSKISDLEMVYFYSSFRQPLNSKLKNVKKYKLPPTFFELLFNRLRNVPVEKFIGSVDIFHSSDWVQPPSKSLKVTTYHDVIPLKFPQWSHPKIVAVHKRRLELVEKEIDMVIAVSETTKKDLLKLTKIPEQKITVVYEGVGSEFKKLPEEQVEDFRKKYNLPQKFVLALGGIGERKNLTRIKKAAKNYELVISGETIPYVSNDDLPLLYNAATVLMYTTLYEGFGLPIVEAMACETAVLTSDLEIHKEIAGKDNAIFVDPDNVDEMAKELEILMEHDDIRKDIAGNGVLQASKFKWDIAAQKTAEVYRKLLNR
jgi:glycosyltransferase involved in cell wall biosynthesis